MPLDAQHTVRVRIYEQAAGGAALFDETHNGVGFFDGYYSLSVGAVQPLAPALFTRPALFVGVSIDDAAELTPRFPLGTVPDAMVAEVAQRAVGHLTPTQISVSGAPVINAAGQWVGPVAGLRGAAGPAGPVGVAGGQGPQGPVGPAGGAGSPDTAAQVFAKLLLADGPASGLDADTLDGIDSAAFVRTPAQVLAAAKQADGHTSGFDADTLDGRDSASFLRTPAQFIQKLDAVDGPGSGIDVDLLDGHHAAEFAQTGPQALALLLAADGHGSGVEADTLDGIDSAQFGRTNRDLPHAANVRVQGDLYVAGASPLKLAGRNAPPGQCNLGRIGQVYYDATIGRIAGCDGNDWIILGGNDSGNSIVDSPVLAWGGNFAEANYEPTAWRDVPGHSMRFTKRDPNSVVRVNAMFSGGYTITCHGSTAAWRLMIDGVEHGVFQGHGSTRNGWRMQPFDYTWFVKNIPVGTHTAHLQVIKHGCSADVRTGWPNGSEDHITVEEIGEGRMAMRQKMLDTRHTPNAWSDLPERAVTYTKKDAGSVLEVVWADTIGYHMSRSGGHACRWRLTMDGAPVDGGRGFLGYNASHTGWRIDGRTFTWRVDGVAPGKHTFAVQLIRPNTNTSECLAGWASPVNTLAVVEQAVGNAAILRHMPDTRHTPNAFSDLPGRQLAHTKDTAGTRVRVTLQDTLGFNMIGHSWGCRWRLTIDGVAKGRLFGSHTNSSGAWRINGHRLQWIVPGITAGAHTYRIQVDRPSAAATSECLAGYPNNEVANFLLVEEIE